MISIVADGMTPAARMPVISQSLQRFKSLNPRCPVAGGVTPVSTAAVHVVDSDRAAQERLAGLFSSVGFETRTYSDFHSFLRAAHPSVPSCLIIDASLSLLGGEHCQEALQKFETALPVVVTASEPKVALAVQAMKAGAVDFLEKPFREDDVLEAARAAIKLDRKRRQKQAQGEELRNRFESLSPRERQVMAMVTAGKLNKQVAWELRLSEITVKVHRGSAMRKMGARTLAELVRMADALAAAGGEPAAHEDMLRT